MVKWKYIRDYQSRSSEQNSRSPAIAVRLLTWRLVPVNESLVKDTCSTSNGKRTLDSDEVGWSWIAMASFGILGNMAPTPTTPSTAS